MLSSEDAELKRVDFPTLRRKRLRSGNSKSPFVVPALTQKIVKISNNVFLGWSGPLGSAVEVIKTLISRLGERSSTHEEMSALVDDINHWKDPRLELSAIGLYGDAWQSFSGSGGIVVHPQLGHIHVLGGGTQQFINHLSKDIFMPFEVDIDDSRPDNIDTIHYALSFMLKSMSRQREFDYAIDKRWGSALELLVVRDGLEKVDNILYQTYRYKRGRTVPKIRPFSNKLFMFYQNDDLIVKTYSPKDGLLEYIISPPQLTILNLPQPTINIRPSIPQLTVTTLIDVDDWTRSRTFIEWFPENNPYATLDFSQEGQGSIKFDPDRVLHYYNNIESSSTSL